MKTKVVKNEQGFPYLVEYGLKGEEVKRTHLMPSIGVWSKDGKTHFDYPAEYNEDGTLTELCLKQIREDREQDD